MKISRLVSTVILTTSIATIYLFGLIFYIYTNADSKTLVTLKDSLSTTSGFFGGITTLVAAYIATRLFNDWKEQHNKTILAEEAKNIYKKIYSARMDFAKYITTVNNCLNKNKNENCIKVTDAYGPIVTFNSKFMVELIFFQKLSKDQQLLSLAISINEVVSSHLNFREKYIDDQLNSTFSDDFLKDVVLLNTQSSDIFNNISDILGTYILCE